MLKHAIVACVHLGSSLCRLYIYTQPFLQTMDRPTKLAKLNALRRSLPHCSASAFSAILEAVSKDGLPEGPVHRHALRAARNQQNLEDTPFGPTLQTIDLVGKDGAAKSIPVAHPLAALWKAVSDCPPFSTYMRDVLNENPPSLDAPWHLVLYSDEVTPGNPLSTANKRKFQAIYWSFLELGGHALSKEEAWFCVVAEYSTTVNALSAGLSQLLGSVVKLFLDPDGTNLATTGMLLQWGDASIRLWAVLGGVIQDGGAHKSVWHSRGDAASRYCLLCKNLFTEESKICDEDGTHLLSCKCLRLSDLVPATSRDIRAVARYIEAQHSVLSPEQFRELQQALGMTYHPHGLLLDRALDTMLDPVDIYMHDWMHALFVDGVCNLSVYLLFESFIVAGHSPIYEICKTYVANWKWPGRLFVKSLPEIFSEDRKDNHRKARHIKCQASDMLSLLPVLAMFTAHVLMTLQPGCTTECIAFLALADVVDLIVASSRLTVPPLRLLQAVEKFLGLFRDAWGVEWLTPKFHWLLHLAGVLHKRGMLLNCFCLERKHRTPKRYATELANTSAATAKTLIMEVTSHHFGQLNDDAAFCFALGLINPRPPSKKMIRLLHSELNINCDEQRVLWSYESRFSKVATCKKNDVIIYKQGDAGEVKAGTVQLQLDVEGVAVASVSVMSFVRSESAFSVWTNSDHVQLIELSAIVDTVLHRNLDNNRVAIILPIEFRHE